MKISAVSPNAQNNSKVSFGLRTDKATQDLVLNSKISETAKILFKNMLSDRTTDRFSLAIREDSFNGSPLFILGLKDKKYPLAKQDNFDYTKLFKDAKDHVVIKRDNDLGNLIKSIFYNEDEFDSYGAYLKHISEEEVKPSHNRVKGMALISSSVDLKM